MPSQDEIDEALRYFETPGLSIGKCGKVLAAALRERDARIEKMEAVIAIARTIQDAYSGEGGYVDPYDDLQAALAALPSSGQKEERA